MLRDVVIILGDKEKMKSIIDTMDFTNKVRRPSNSTRKTSTRRMRKRRYARRSEFSKKSSLYRNAGIFVF